MKETILGGFRRTTAGFDFFFVCVCLCLVTLYSDSDLDTLS